MSEAILAGINSILPELESQNTKGIGSFDLNDETFSNILDDKLEGLEDKNKSAEQDIVSQLGVPAGLNIEGFDYNAFISDFNPTESVDEINTDSNIQDNKFNKFSINSMLEDAVDAFSPVVKSIANSEFNLNPESSSNPLNAVKDFWNNQASNFYNIMSKDAVNSITDLVAKL